MADTIAAIATAPAKSAIGIVRISGDNAFEISKKIFSGDLSEPRKMVTGKLFSSGGEVCDYGMGVFFKAPASFTGEDSVELYCHGSTAVLRTVLSALFSAGARPAEAGEFTRRAFLNGKMDLTQAEAVIDLIDSETELAAKNAAEQMNGTLGKEITSLSAHLAAIAAEFYAFVYYPDDEIEQTERDELAARLYECAGIAKKIAGTYDKGRIFREGVRVALIGKPNVGKSSLLNALLGTERSIVTDIEGTTRDTVEESLRAGNVALHLIDTAGLRNADTEPERLGIKRSEAAARDADIVVAVFDGSSPLDKYDMQTLDLAKSTRSLCVINKNDLGTVIDKSVFGDLPVIEISAKTNIGTDLLIKKICEIINISDIPCDGKTLTNPRHASTLIRAEERIRAAADAFLGGIYADLAVSDIEDAINILGEITGNSAQDTIINEIFSRFCVGK
ncbi:MAG: tRNA uridine-5-carboxymethylaminomethyl(34) synthesis GTPase MnmE [Oscillospiraceae bacterium]|nr:tRNA uridine-5-carboxymethylaminomethyl(34) synthesis GTPase MnmE [Oscillospiraceae bacterium]